MRKDLYSAIDLHSNNSYLAIIDSNDTIVYQRRLNNDLELILEKLEPYRDRPVSTALESTFNWYWLADGLIEAGYKAELVNTSAVKQYAGLKHTDDRHDAFHLAHLRRLGILPTSNTRGRRMKMSARTVPPEVSPHRLLWAVTLHIPEPGQKESFPDLHTSDPARDQRSAPYPRGGTDRYSASQPCGGLEPSASRAWRPGPRQWPTSATMPGMRPMKVRRP